MKTLLFLILLVPAVGFCQGFHPRWEMSLSTDANSFSSPGGNNNYASLAVRPGLFLVEGLSIEPEFLSAVAKGIPPALNVSGNLSYSYGIGYNVVVPFALVGYGVGDGLPFNQPLIRSAGYMTGIRFLNLGAGLKIMTLGGRALFRVEYRYQDFDEVYLRSSPHVYARRILLGFSVLL
ncbi:MAG TPA: hypothetical protein VIS48_00940 [Candidatus Kryptonia bacterium]